MLEMHEGTPSGGEKSPAALETALSILGDEQLPPWCSVGRLAYAMELDEPTPSNNVIKNMHWSVYRALRRKWQQQIFIHGLQGRHVRHPIEHSALVIIRRCSGRLDWDNAYGGLKPVLDCLVARTPKNPDGLGLVRDDNPSNMPYPPYLLQRAARRKNGSTALFVFEV